MVERVETVFVTAAELAARTAMEISNVIRHVFPIGVYTHVTKPPPMILSPYLSFFSSLLSNDVGSHVAQSQTWSVEI
jgi:hypothetical protein